MQTWTQLSRLALIGTEQQAPTPVSVGEPELDQILAGTGSVEQRESYALSSGAGLTLARRSGYKPALTTHAPSPASLETKARPPELAGQFLARMLRGYLPQVLPEWLELAGSAGFRVPEELLPELLDQARAKTELRPLAKLVLGQRGAWLAAQNPDWSFAIDVSNAEKSWQEGKHTERVAALRELRQTDPARGRELLSASWKDEPPDERADFIRVLSVNLSLDDEAFLESALDDKRKEVRAGAIRLLGSMADSKLVRRLKELAATLVHLKKQLLRGTSLEIALPAECTKEMGRYGVGTTKPPAKDIGEKAWWLKEMLEAIPPAHWTATLGLPAKDLIAAAQKSEFAAVLLAGWSEATVRYHDRDWAVAWLAREDTLAYAPNFAKDLHADLEALEWAISAFLRQSELYHALLDKLPPRWSRNLAQSILTKLQGKAAGSQIQTDYVQRMEWKTLLERAALAIPPDLPQATSGWPKDLPQNQIREVVDEFCAVIEFRRAIHRHLKGEK